jgi:bla regulator protein BlaR1
MNFLTLFVQWLLAASLRASLLAAAVIILRIVWGRQLSAQCRYAFWLPVVLAFIMPALWASQWTLENRLALLGTAIPPAAMMLLRSNFGAVATIAVSMPTAWLLGASTAIALAGMGYSRTLRHIKSGAVPADPLLTAAVAVAARQVRLPRLPLILVSTAVESPAVTGLFRVVLLLPKDFLADFTPAEIRLILLHELTHLRRYDLPLNWLLCALQAAHWFNPWLWFVFSRMRSDREEACDAQVLSACEEDHRAEYGHALLKLHDYKPNPGLNLAFTGARERDKMRSRLLAITRHRQTHPAWNAIGAVMIAGLMLLGVIQFSTRDSEGEAGDGKGQNFYIRSSATEPGIAAGVLTPQVNEHALSVSSASAVEGRVPRIRQTPTTNQGNALPEWWPAASSARILFNRELPRKGELHWDNHRLMAALGELPRVDHLLR